MPTSAQLERTLIHGVAIHAIGSGAMSLAKDHGSLRSDRFKGHCGDSCLPSFSASYAFPPFGDGLEQLFTSAPTRFDHQMEPEK